ncbi:MAG TPA: YaiO family outer membrane beta-barrel protein [Candidatus Baltobacteraceae bacterium]|nr:YaiO family outer membrane beta-barrel protein [Candidatus Baltobacteraceae bacterium]
MSIFAALMIAASVAAGPAPTASPAPPAVLDYQAGVTHETLSNDRPDWDSQYLLLTRKTADNQTVYVEFETTSRFDRVDDRLTLGMYLPLSAQWMFFGEGSTSNTHAILPASSVTAGVQYNSGGHWYEGIAARHTEYDANSVNAGVFSLEHYWNRYRVYYALTAADLAGTGTDVEHSLEVDRYYGKQGTSYVGVSLTTGREIDNVGLPALLTSHVDGWSVLGRHWVNDRWGIVYGAGTFNQGTLYSRAGGHLGIDYRF